MKSSTHSKAVLELGKRLVANLGLADDLLGQWLAHDISARMDAIENNPELATAAMRDECVKAILGLWEHRHALPEHLKPLQEIEPITKTLAALDVEHGDDYRYFRPILREAALDTADEPMRHWLELAFNLDYSARVLIQHALQSAGTAAALEAKPWVEAALKAGVEAEPDRQTIEFLLDRLYSDDTDHEEKIEMARKKTLRDKILRLESFAELAEAVAAELREKLDTDQGFQNEP
ncbi:MULTISPECIES: hypothetical protein [Pseudomonas syringae group]|nr:MULTISPECIES: hypothetical protein [Pseudomonas syringae group]AVB22841.1 hypothetical protein BKM03_29285 [Pseudomonas avellanae]EGH14140.1 hypothetical protein PSYMP_26808 [Pseudomonas amygdali pv. morsprunorum str. M302280]KWS59949.1 hypothetical protein AL055_02710 [Pseudomonas amygdali pv. morsprunorum]PHN35705.1 hypothetical protein AO261_11895 [Pseudomonas avellanae]POC81619.1 hypothetical protein BKM26_28680 [Pseudomonas avellanae]